jgi:hypothetical protein
MWGASGVWGPLVNERVGARAGGPAGQREGEEGAGAQAVWVGDGPKGRLGKD